MEFGYVEPGHGLKEKKEWIFDEEDIKRMIEVHTRSKKAREISLWCYCAVERQGRRSKSRSRSKSPIAKPRSS